MSPVNYEDRDCLFRVECSPGVIDQIGRRAADGLAALPRVGIGVGGLLLGESSGEKSLKLVDTVEIPCSHAAGPSFSLTAEEKKRVRELIANSDSLRVLGWYCSKTRGTGLPTGADLAFFHELFPEPGQIFLIVRPSFAGPTRACLYYRDGTGEVIGGQERDFNDIEFVVEAGNGAAPADSLDQLTPIPDVLGSLTQPANGTPKVTDLPPQSEPPRAEPPGPEAAQAKPAPRIEPEEAPQPKTPGIQKSAKFQPELSAADVIGAQAATTQPDAAAATKGNDAEPHPSPARPPIQAESANVVRRLHTKQARALARLLIQPEPTNKPATTETPIVTDVGSLHKAPPPHPSAPVQPEPVHAPAQNPGADLVWLRGIFAQHIPPQQTGRRTWLIGIAAVLTGGFAYVSKNSWLPRPPVTLTFSDSNGSLRIGWNPRSVRGIRIAALYISDGGELRTFSLNPDQLQTGFMQYTRTSPKVTATLDTGDAKATASFVAPEDPSSPAPQTAR